MLRSKKFSVASLLFMSVVTLTSLSGCGGGLSSNNTGGKIIVDPPPPSQQGRTFFITPGPDATQKMQEAMIQLLPKDVIQFDCGYFELTSTLQVIDTEDVLIKGCGKDKTILSFKNNNTPEGILAVNVHGFTVQDLTVLDTGGNGFELRGVDHGTLTRVRAIWSSGGGRNSSTPINASNFSANNARLLNVPCTDPATQNPANPENMGGDTTSPDYTVSPQSGRYGIYPVSSENILIEESESVGASDAGIYVGQTNNAIIRKSRAAFNVFGFEIENVKSGEYDTNVAECNTGGFLIYDLDGLRQYGDRSVMKGNKSINNNTYNFTAGGFVGNVPPGSGMITLAYDRIDVYDNEFTNNNTGGIIHASYELFPAGAGRPDEHRIDFYTEGMHIYRNKFKNNGNHLPLPSSADAESQNVAHFLPALVGAKTAVGCLNPLNVATCAAASAPPSNPPGVLPGYRGAHIVWDGLLDAYDASCPYPKDASGNPVPKDARGKPILTNAVPDPSCHYNAYKFNTNSAGNPRIKPDWFASCIDDDNQFDSDSLAYVNFNGTKGLNAAIALVLGQSPTPQQFVELQQLPASFDLAPHKCVTAYGKNLEKLPDVVIPPFVPSGNLDPALTVQQTAALCNASVASGQVNFDAAKADCPTLDQYHLFSDVEDPRSTPNGGGLPFSLNTKLFSDYAVKYRVAYIPPGTHAVYNDKLTNGVNATVVFPVGTIIAKTFAFRNATAQTEDPIETRLIIKRINSKGNIARWDGLPYIWSRDANGKRVAKLSMIGGTQSVSWDMTDVDSGAHHSGSTNNYLVPNRNQCLSCHSNEDKDPGAAPIGPKIRNLNGAYRSESDVVTGQSRHDVAGKNQVKYWCDKGVMIGCPSTMTLDVTKQTLTNLERLPIFNKTGDGGANTNVDIESRTRAYLEVNCEHCHNDRGYAASTGFYLDSFRTVDQKYGICKTTTATGAEGRGGHIYDIVPGSSADSIVAFRTGPTATTPSARMPPIARSVYHDEGNALITKWIDDVVRKTYTDGSCGTK